MLGFRSALCLAAAIVTACVTPPAPPQAAVADLAPGGKLRAAINFGNPILATKDAASGQPRGVSLDLSRELAELSAEQRTRLVNDLRGR